MDSKASLLPITQEIQALSEQIQAEIENGKKNAYLAVEQEKKLTYWKIGKHIKAHLLKYEDGTDYGANLVGVLAENLEMGIP